MIRRIVWTIGVTAVGALMAVYLILRFILLSLYEIGSQAVERFENGWTGSPRRQDAEPHNEGSRP